MAYQEYSNDAAYKLRAGLTVIGKITDPDLSPDYIDACRRWYAGLSPPNRLLAFIATNAFTLGNDKRALQVAKMLPAAPCSHDFPQDP